MSSSLSVILRLVAVLSLTCFTTSSERSFRTKDFYNNDIIVQYEPVGCFKDTADRALRNMYYNQRGSIEWSRPNITVEIVKACAKKAYEKGYRTVFGVQFYGECWSDGNAQHRFSNHGSSQNCDHGVGKHWANFVYRFSAVNSQSVKSCTVNGKNYNIGDTMYIPNDWSSKPENAICQKCTCSSDGNPTDCIINYYCDLGLGSLCAKYKNVAGKCCPVCDCYNDGQVMPVGSSWPVKINGGICSMCTCGENGVATCTHKTSCSVCYGEEKPNPGQCCPKCVAPTTTTQAPKTLPTERPPPDLLPKFPGGR